mmetsp:Transcript_32572/g.74949  ORF Transcript_32572/g.74949 Transcript_32572/m.74949 type:complete len:332 (+) Transcript_32572:186-1181(+)
MDLFLLHSSVGHVEVHGRQVRQGREIPRQVQDGGLDEPLELIAALSHGLQHLVVVGGLFALVPRHGHHVGDERREEDLHATMVRRQHFRNRRHPHGVAVLAQEPALRLRLVHGPERHAISAVVSHELPEPQRVRRLHSRGPHRPVVRVRRGGKPRSELVVVPPHQRILPRHAGQREVVRHAHHVAHLISRVEASAGAGDHERLGAEAAHDPDGEGHGGHGETLVGMKATAETDRADRRGGAVGRDEFAEDHLALVARDGREGKVGDFGVGDGDGVLQRIGQAGEARPAYDSHRWFVVAGPCAKIFGYRPVAWVVRGSHLEVSGGASRYSRD